MSDAASLKRHLEWLYGKGGVYGGDGSPCRCEHAWKPLGRDGSVNMGSGWVRTTTHPNCPHHPITKKAGGRNG